MRLLLAALLALSSISQLLCDCSVSLGTACPEHEKLKLPETQEELNTNCEVFLRYLICTEEYEENCGSRSDVLQRTGRLISFVQRACNNETSIYKAVAGNLECIRRAILQDSCEEALRSEDPLMKFEQQLRNHNITVIANGDRDTWHCTSKLFVASCKGLNIGEECGESSKVALTEIFQNLIYSLNECTDDVVDELPTIVQFLEEEKSKEADILESTIVPK